jgi:hypothetical protein
VPAPAPAPELSVLPSTEHRADPAVEL